MLNSSRAQTKKKYNSRTTIFVKKKEESVPFFLHLFSKKVALTMDANVWRLVFACDVVCLSAFLNFLNDEDDITIANLLQSLVSMQCPILHCDDVIADLGLKLMRKAHLKAFAVVIPIVSRSKCCHFFKAACREGYSLFVAMLLALLTPEDICAKDNHAFRLVCFYGHSEIVKILVPYLTAEDICAKDNDAFRSACENGYLEIVELLLPRLTPEDIRVTTNAKESEVAGML